MTLHSGLVIPFRNRIANRYRIWCVAACGIAVVAIVLLCTMETMPYLKYLFASVVAFAGFMAIDLWIHRGRMLRTLNPEDASWSVNFDAYLTAKLQRWDQDVMKRIAIGTALVLITLLLLFYKGDRQWLSISASLLIVFILYSMLISWNNFLDGILLHDVRRTIRDQAPDTSA